VVYVDETVDYGDLARQRGLRWTVWSHMFADSVDELHAMADSLGLKRIWFQNKHNFPHYDVVPSKRNLAIRFGAKAVTQEESIAIWDRICSYELRENYDNT
jgi:Protein of unknown function (DUF4031)